MSIAVTVEEMLRRARARGANVDAMCAEIGCTKTDLRKIKKDDHWLSKVVLLEAALRCVQRRGHLGFQTTLMHFTGDPA